MIMAVWRSTARLAAVCVGAGTLLALGVSPAQAAEDTVRVSAAGKFRAGDSAEEVVVEVRKRTEGCVQLQAALTLYLEGLRPDQVRVQVNAGGRWLPVELSAGRGGVATAAASPENPQLCRGKRVKLRYEVAFAADTVDGQLTVVGEAVSPDGQVIGRDSDAAKVIGGSPAAAPTPSATPVPTVAATAAATTAASTAVDAVTDPGGDADSAAPARSSGGSGFLYAGLAMVAVGVVLIILLVRRFREDRSVPAGGTHPPAGYGYAGPGQPPGIPPVPPIPGQRGPGAPAPDDRTRFIPRLPD
ncbi:hypothetical protein [Salinispora sp. H7-4]|uniref:hypothetical protein n=1 Tax=Salinispora sp. H7-4 TaxID=2748321 RepID=UPI0015D2C572|nr:hypothetical protein [Salinispora sp. H7-4]NYT94129.1 hypothetical protein [Salinispora sp. H7-4]